MSSIFGGGSGAGSTPNLQSLAGLLGGVGTGTLGDGGGGGGLGMGTTPDAYDASSLTDPLTTAPLALGGGGGGGGDGTTAQPMINAPDVAGAQSGGQPAQTGQQTGQATGTPDASQGQLPPDSQLNLRQIAQAITGGQKQAGPTGWVPQPATAGPGATAKVTPPAAAGVEQPGLQDPLTTAQQQARQQDQPPEAAEATAPDATAPPTQPAGAAGAPAPRTPMAAAGYPSLPQGAPGGLPGGIPPGQGGQYAMPDLQSLLRVGFDIALRRPGLVRDLQDLVHQVGPHYGPPGYGPGGQASIPRTPGPPYQGAPPDRNFAPGDPRIATAPLSASEFRAPPGSQMSGRPSQPNVDRRQFKKEENEATIRRAAAMVMAEVGSGNTRQRIIQLETAFNRAQYRGIPLSQALLTTQEDPQRGYYPRMANVSREQVEEFYRNVWTPVMNGSNLSDAGAGPMTGNASQGVAQRQFARGTQGYQMRNGESYFRERVQPGQGLPTLPTQTPEATRVARAPEPATAGEE